MPRTSVSKVFLKLSRIIESGANTDMVMDKLNEIDDSQMTNKKLEELIIQTCCELYQINPEDILTPRYVKKEHTPARNMSVVLIRKYIKEYSNDHIGNIFHKDHCLVSRALSDFNKMSEKIKHERVFLQHYASAKATVEIHINN